MTYSQSQLNEQGLESTREASKHLQLSLENSQIVRSNNDRENRILKQQQEELLKYMKSANLREELQRFKDVHGHPKVVDLEDNLDRIQSLR